MQRLLRPWQRHHRDVPAWSRTRRERSWSPFGDSTLITSAPKYASTAPAKFPATTWPRSRTRMPARGPRACVGGRVRGGLGGGRPCGRGGVGWGGCGSRGRGGRRTGTLSGGVCADGSRAERGTHSTGTFRVRSPLDSASAGAGHSPCWLSPGRRPGPSRGPRTGEQGWSGTTATETQSSACQRPARPAWRTRCPRGPAGGRWAQREGGSPTGCAVTLSSAARGTARARETRGEGWVAGRGEGAPSGGRHVRASHRGVMSHASDGGRRGRAGGRGAAAAPAPSACAGPCLSTESSRIGEGPPGGTSTSAGLRGIRAWYPRARSSRRGRHHICLSL